MQSLDEMRKDPAHVLKGNGMEGTSYSTVKKHTLSAE
jgi:hypothetical protein